MPEPYEELPTVPPPPRRGPTGLRWAGSPPAEEETAGVPPTEAVTRTLPAMAPPSVAGAPAPPAVGPIAGAPAGGADPPASPTVASPTVASPTAAPSGEAVPPAPAEEVTQRLLPVEVPPLARRGPRSRRLTVSVVTLLVAASVGVLAALGAVFVLAPGVGRHGPGAVLPAPPVAFARMVRSLTGAERLAESAVGAACQYRAPGSPARGAALSQLDRAAAEDRSVLRMLETGRARLTAWPPGAGLVGPVAGLASASLVADGDYSGWLQDLQATGCYSAPGNNLYHKRALEAAVTEEAAARRLSRAWGPVARRYDLTPS